jgi:hypothetical protein
MCATFRESGHREGGTQVSDQDRDKLSKDEDATDDVEAHKLSRADDETDNDGDDVEAHKLGGGG